MRVSNGENTSAADPEVDQSYGRGLGEGGKREGMIFRFAERQEGERIRILGFLRWLEGRFVLIFDGTEKRKANWINRKR